MIPLFSLLLIVVLSGCKESKPDIALINPDGSFFTVSDTSDNRSFAADKHLRICESGQVCIVQQEVAPEPAAPIPRWKPEPVQKAVEYRTQEAAPIPIGMAAPVSVSPSPRLSPLGREPLSDLSKPNAMGLLPSGQTAQAFPNPVPAPSIWFVETPSGSSAMTVDPVSNIITVH